MRALVVAVAIVALGAPGLGSAKSSGHGRGARAATRSSHRAGSKGVHVAAAAPAPPPAPAPGRAPVAPAPPAPPPAAPAPPPSGGTTAPAPPLRPGAAPPPRGAPYQGPTTHPTFPAPGPYGPGRVYPYGYSPYSYYPYFAPFGFGFDFGSPYYPYYPYYPSYPSYPYEPYEPSAPSEPYYGEPLYQQPTYPYAVQPEITTEMDLHGAGTNNGGAAGVSVGIESRRFGFEAAVDGFYLDRLYGPRYFGTSGTLGVASLHGTFSIVSSDAYRLRLEAGGSLISWPDTFVSAGAVSVGPDVGVSGRLRLVGPLGIVGFARFTPAPVTAVDALGALALQFGNFAVTGGWRELSVDRHQEVPPVEFGGPQIGFALLF